MKVAVIGQGYVGLSVAIGAASSGHEVVGYDLDSHLIINLKKGSTFVPGIEKALLQILINTKKYIPTDDPSMLNGNSVVIIAVPTPLDQNREPDLSYLAGAASLIAENCDESALIINESTSYPGTLRNFIKPRIESISSVSFKYASAPERIDPDNRSWNIFNTPRVVGGLDKNDGELAANFYKSFCSQVHIVSSPEVAEASKLFENTFRQVNIALANEFSIISSALNFSTNEAISAAATKPFGFMPFFPSIGVGGHCIPVDPSYLSYSAAQAGVKSNLIELSNSINLSMVKYVANKIEKEIHLDLSRSRIQIVGIAYKPNVSDLRESPALELIKELRGRRAQVTWHDPVVHKYKGEFSRPLDANIDLGLIVTPHNGIDYSLWKTNNTQVIDLSSNSLNYGWTKFL